MHFGQAAEPTPGLPEIADLRMTCSGHKRLDSAPPDRFFESIHFFRD